MPSSTLPMLAVVYAIVAIVISYGVDAFIGNLRPSTSSRRGEMSMAARLPLVAGNWKMNTDLDSAVALACELAALTKGADPKKVLLALHLREIPPYESLFYHHFSTFDY